MPILINQITNILKKGGVGILPTDTIYGIVGSALNIQTVERIYKLRKRTPDKPMIILISSIDDLNKFNFKISENTQTILKKLWPNPLSIVLPCADDQFEYLHRGTNSMAFRFPNNPKLLKILRQTGPLVAPSANFEGEKPAETIEDTKQYFGDTVDFYQDSGTLNSPPSTIIKIENNKIKILRQGSFKP